MGFASRFPSVLPGRVGRAPRARAQPIQRGRRRRERFEQVEEQLRQLACVVEQQAVHAVADALGKAGAVVERHDRDAGAEQVGDLHRDVHARRRSMEAKAEVGAAYNPRVVLGVEPPGTQRHAARWQARKPALELRAAVAVAGHQNHQVREISGSGAQLPIRGSDPRGYPTASITTSKSSSAVQLVGHTMNPTAPAPRISSRENSACRNLLPLGALHRNEGGRRPIVRARARRGS